MYLSPSRWMMVLALVLVDVLIDPLEQELEHLLMLLMLLRLRLHVISWSYADDAAVSHYLFEKGRVVYTDESDPQSFRAWLARLDAVVGAVPVGAVIVASWTLLLLCLVADAKS